LVFFLHRFFFERVQVNIDRYIQCIIIIIRVLISENLVYENTHLTPTIGWLLIDVGCQFNSDNSTIVGWNTDDPQMSAVGL